LNDGLTYALEVREFINFQDMVDKALVLENRRGIMERKRKMQRTGPQGSNTRVHFGSSWREKGRCSALDLRGATQEFILVLSRRDLISAQVSRLDNTECKLWDKDFKLPNDKFNAPTSRLLALHHHHLRETTLDRVS
jgi:hypothetical protein